MGEVSLTLLSDRCRQMIIIRYSDISIDNRHGRTDGGASREGTVNFGKQEASSRVDHRAASKT